MIVPLNPASNALQYWVREDAYKLHALVCRHIIKKSSLTGESYAQKEESELSRPSHCEEKDIISRWEEESVFHCASAIQEKAKNNLLDEKEKEVTNVHLH
jgi:NMD protein affecting ribosome stability and mRNA decay